MSLRCRCAGHGSLRTIPPTRAAFARPGPGTIPFPDVKARMQPSDSLIPFGLGYGLPLPSAYLAAGARSCCPRQPAACAPAGTLRVGDGSPALSAKSGSITRRNQGLPGFRAILFERAVVVDPAGCESLLAHDAETAVAFRLHEALGTQNERCFVAAIPTAHSLAYLRIDDPVTAIAARLATGMGGLTPRRAGFAPAR